MIWPEALQMIAGIEVFAMAKPEAKTESGKKGGDALKAQLVLDNANAVAILTLSGEWTVKHLPEEARVKLQDVPKNFTKLVVNGTSLDEVDTSGAWLIVQTMRSLHFKDEQIELMGFSDSHAKIVTMIGKIKHEKLPSKNRSPTYNALVTLGKGTVDTVKGSKTLTAFFGQLCLCIVRTFKDPRRLRFKSIIFHANEIGIQALPIVIMMAFFISLVLGYQGANQLRQFGAKEYTINLVGISLLREMGVLITAIMVSGRSCSAFASQIGVMQMNDEVAAMRTLGLDPFELLVLPRILALILVLPALTFVADIAGLAGTYFIANSYLGISYAQFMHRMDISITEMTFYIGLMKAPVFAFFIGMIGCYQGLQVRTSATELGLRTTAAVVQSIFWVVLLDAIFSVIFTSLNI